MRTENERGLRQIVARQRHDQVCRAINGEGQAMLLRDLAHESQRRFFTFRIALPGDAAFTISRRARSRGEFIEKLTG